MDDALVERVADIIIAVLIREENGEPGVWFSNYDQTPAREAFNIDGEVHPMDIARAVLAIPDLRLAEVKEGLEMAAKAVDAEYNLRRSHHEAAKAAKLRKEARDFETMAIAHSQSASAIRSLGPHS